MKRISALFIVLSSLVTPCVADSPLPQEVVINGVEFVHVPAGEFWHGVPDGLVDIDNNMDHEVRDVKVWLDGFYIAKFEARARDFLRFMNSDAKQEVHEKEYEDGALKGCSVQQDDNGRYFELRPKDNLPVTHLSWNLARDFANYMGFRLPTEAEWTKAARGLDKRIWPWGNEHPDDTFAGYNSGSSCHPIPVDSYPNGKSPYGALGMAGGVYEYVQDWHNPDFYLSLKDGDRNPVSTEPMSARSETTGEFGDLKVLRGGRWGSAAKGITIYARNATEADVGFRCYGTRFAVDEDQVRTYLASGQAQIATAD